MGVALGVIVGIGVGDPEADGVDGVALGRRQVGSARRERERGEQDEGCRSMPAAADSRVRRVRRHYPAAAGRENG